MKRVVVAVCFFILSVALGVITSVSFNNISDSFITQTEKCLELAMEDNTPQLIEETRKLGEMWEKNRRVFSVVTYEEDMGVLDINYPALIRLLQSESLDAYSEKCMECINLLRSLKKNNEINLGNIL